MSGPFKAICKKNVILIVSKFSLKKENEYLYRKAINTEDTEYKTRYIVDDGNDNRCQFSENDFKEYFYTLQEMRKQKLNKINERKSNL